MTKEKHPLEELFDKMGFFPIVNYKGVLVTKLIGGFSVFGKKYSTPQEIDKAILEAGKCIEKSFFKES